MNILGLPLLLAGQEGSGILNWALAGLQMAFTNINETGNLLLSNEQNRRIDALLPESGAGWWVEFFQK